MRKLGLAILLMGLVCTGIAMADPGISPVPEVQGLHIETTVIAVGNIDQETSVDMTVSSGQSLGTMPPLEDGSMYEAVYTEDTHSAGLGYISYDKDFDMDTSAKKSGQYNIETTRQITFVGIDAGSIYSTEYIMMGSSGTPQGAAGRLICPFADGNAVYPAFCNRVESGSTISMSVANVLTTTNARFIMDSGDHPVELNNNVMVSEYSDGIPSKGSVSAFIKGTVHEGLGEDPENLGEAISFSDSTSFIGDISLFEKKMHYESVWGG